MMTKDELLAPLARVRGEAVVVTTMGAVRAWARHSTHPFDFASADSAMGHAADLALGIALARPEQKVICLNGDGSMQMSLGTLVTIVDAGPKNLVLFVLENRTYEITGNQRVPGAGMVDFAAMARAAGFPRVYSLNSPAEAAQRMPEIVTGPGPVFVAATVAPGEDRPLRRGPSEPELCLRTSLAEAARQVRFELQNRAGGGRSD